MSGKVGDWYANYLERKQAMAMTFNAAGLRAGYMVTPYGASQPTLNEQFTYRGGQLAQTVTISGTTTYTDTYVYSQHGMPLELLRTTNGTTNRYWYERDGLGNVVELTDASGTVVDQYTYDLWGKPTTVSESVPQRLRYQGYWYDNELGWYWLSYRAYDPTLERFLQPDPSEQDGLYSYAYVNDDPVDMNDPSGFAPAPIYCDSACQNQIYLNNVWPEGMSVDQFQSYGGNPDAPIISGYDAGSHQWMGDPPHSSATAAMGPKPPQGGDVFFGQLQDTWDCNCKPGYAVFSIALVTDGIGRWEMDYDARPVGDMRDPKVQSQVHGERKFYNLQPCPPGDDCFAWAWGLPYGGYTDFQIKAVRLYWEGGGKIIRKVSRCYDPTNPSALIKILMQRFPQEQAGQE